MSAWSHEKSGSRADGTRLVISVAWSVCEQQCRARLHYFVAPFARLSWQTAVKKKKKKKKGSFQRVVKMEMVPRVWNKNTLHVKFISNLLRKIRVRSWLWCWVQVKSVTLACSVRLSLLIFLSLSCLKFMDFLISLFLFSLKKMIIVIPRSLPKKRPRSLIMGHSVSMFA